MRIRNRDEVHSVRMNKEEWEAHKLQGDNVFKNRKVGYMSIAQGKIIFDKISPLFKDLRTLDESNEEYTEEEKTRNKQVADEIAAKNR